MNMLRAPFALVVFVVASLHAQPVSVAPESFKVGAFEFKCPAGWEWIQAGGMRKAQLRTPGLEGLARADAVFFHFGPGQGGGVEQNVDRWFSQFTEARDKIGAETAKVKIGEVNVTMVRAKGTFSSGMPGGPTTPLANYALLGAILESPEGDVFVKLTGPAPVVEAVGESFKQMVRSGCEK